MCEQNAVVLYNMELISLTQMKTIDFKIFRNKKIALFNINLKYSEIIDIYMSKVVQR